MRQNIDLFSLAINNADMAEIAKMDRGDGVAWASGDPSKLSHESLYPALSKKRTKLTDHTPIGVVSAAGEVCRKFPRDHDRARIVYLLPARCGH
jgi:hypothetical protein